MTARVTPTMTAMPSRVGTFSRIYGLGSIYAKTLRDSRLAFIVVAGLLGGLMLGVGGAFASEFSTPQARHEIAALIDSLPPILLGLTGKIHNVETLGGYMTFKYGPYFVFIAGLWSILALSGTLAGEARRGSLDLVAATPHGQRQIAVEKLGAHLTAMALAMAILGLAAWIAGNAFARLPGDEISLAAAASYALGTGLLALASGSVAFALAPLLGRAPAAAIAAAVMIGGYLLQSYSASVPAFAGLASLTWFGWTSGHAPLSGLYDWPSLIPVAAVAAALLVVGVELFARRDVGATASLRTPALPGWALGDGGPIRRSLAERLPAALGWGIGLGLFAFVMAAASGSLAGALDGLSPQTRQIFQNVLPQFDLTTAGGFMQLVFMELGLIVAGFAAATLVGGWASDETSGRLEMLLSTPMSPAAWALRSGLGLFFAVAILTAVLVAAVGAGALLAGSDPLTPMAGSLMLGLYAAALVGIGMAVGGLVRTSLAAEVVALIVVATFLVDLLAPPFHWPDWVHQLAITAHLGQPLVGVWDLVGIGLCLALAVGGLLLGALGMRRRDVAR
jgi:ABC-2 type transport system permease protein